MFFCCCYDSCVLAKHHDRVFFFVDSRRKFCSRNSPWNAILLCCSCLEDLFLCGYLVSQWNSFCLMCEWVVVGIFENGVGRGWWGWMSQLSNCVVVKKILKLFNQQCSLHGIHMLEYKGWILLKYQWTTIIFSLVAPNLNRMGRLGTLSFFLNIKNLSFPWPLL